MSSGCTGPGVSQVVQAKVSPYLYFARCHLVCAIKQSEMAASCVGLGDSQAKPSSESRLTAAGAGLGLTEASGCLFDRM